MSDKAQSVALGGRLREARKLAGLSQGQVASILNLHRPSVSEIESGNRRVSAQEISKFAEIYDVSTAWLLGNTADALSVNDPRLELAARELAKLRPDDLSKLLKLLAAMRNGEDESTEGGDE